MISALVACNWSQIRFFILANVSTCMSEGFWPNFDQINISHRRPCSLWIVNLLTWQKAPEGGFDEKSWEMACNWLMMTSSGDDNRPSGSLGLLTDKTKKNKSFNKRKNRALLTLRRSQKHYEIFSNNVFRKNVTRKQLRSETIEIARFRVGLVPGL